MKNKKNIAVVGAGLFGCTISLILSRKHKVDLYERKPDILNESSMCNQFRFHEGFHYPKSQKTINEIKKSNLDFVKFYGKDVFGKTKNYYGISKYKTKISFKNYTKFLVKNNLNFKKIENSELTSNKIDSVIITNEKNLNYFKIKKKIKSKLKNSKINLKLNTELDLNILKDNKYDHLILATYKNNNDILKNIGIEVDTKFKFELVEKIVIQLPKKYKNISFVVMDGEFVNVDPYLGTKYHLLSHVKYSKLKIIKSYFSKFNKKYDQMLRLTKFRNIKESKFKKFINDGSKYLPFLNKAKYKFSFLVVRTVKVNSDITSERTNLIKKINKNTTTILAGKWNTCVTLAKKIYKSLG